MKKQLLSLALLLFVFIIAGCAGSSTMTSTDIYKGTDGLVMKFVPNAPPDAVFENAIVPIGIEIRNKGAYDIENGLITFSLEEDYMLLDKSSAKSSVRGAKEPGGVFEDIGRDRVNWEAYKPQIRFSLDGRSVERADGEEEIIIINSNAKALEELSQIHESAILATGCYGYKTQLFTTVCIDTDIYNLKKIQKSCKVMDQKYTNQGAPVTIANIFTEIMPMDIPNRIRPQFLIYAQNKGNGLVLKKDAEIISDACSEKPLNYSKWNVVYINAYLGGDQKQINCDITDKQEGEAATKTGTIKLSDNMGVARCWLDEGIDESKGTYVAPLRVELDYGYTTTISKNIIIKKPMVR